MQDRLHQPYRSKLIPGLSEIIRQLTPSSHPGLLGICLSGEMQHLPHYFNYSDRRTGAGPTILALATHNFEKIADAIIAIFKKENNHTTECQWQVLEPAKDGAIVEKCA